MALFCFLSLALTAYLLVVAACVVMMIFSTIFGIQMMAYVQTVTPPQLIGKVMSLVSCLVLCAHPLGQAIYGVLFEAPAESMYLIVLGALTLCILLSAVSKRVIRQIETPPTPTADASAA